MPLRQRLKSAFTHRAWKLPLAVFLTYSAAWTLIEPATALLGLEVDRGVAFFAVLVTFSVVVGFVVATPVASVAFRPRTMNTQLTVSFGDLFQARGIKVIPVNEHFDCELGDLVAPKSLHGQLITRVFGGYPESAEARLNELLEPHKGQPVDRKKGRPVAYPIGTTVLLERDSQSFLLVALAHTDPETHKAHATVSDLWSALEGLWEFARQRAGGREVSVPLVGGGLSGVGLPPQHLLQLLILSIITETKRQEVTSQINIVLSPHLVGELDLRSLKKEWA